MPALTFTLPHWLYWAGLLLFPLIAAYLVRRQLRIAPHSRPALFIAYLVVTRRWRQAAVAAGRVSEDETHGRNSITVLPIRTGVPIGTLTAVVTFALSRYVPLVDPRSSTYHSEPRGDSLACRVDA